MPLRPREQGWALDRSEPRLWGLDLVILLPQGGTLTRRSLCEPGAVAVRMLSRSHGRCARVRIEVSSGKIFPWGWSLGSIKHNDADLWGQVRVGRCQRQPLHLHNPNGLFPCSAPRWFRFLGAKAGAEQGQSCTVPTRMMENLSLSP